MTVTVPPLHLHRRTPTPPINHGARVCTGCQARPLREHGLACPDVTAARPGLAYPAEARVFRGWLNALPLIALTWAPVIVIARLIWSN